VKFLIHADGALPNLALMRLATYFRAQGEEVRLVRGAGQRQLWDPPGEAFGSSIFSFSAALRARIEAEWGDVRWGGTGVRVESTLSEVATDVDWEAVAPDHSLYPGEDRSIGFTQRGCRLKCPFCVVPRKEGAARSVRTIDEIWRANPGPLKKILLLDNDFFGQSRDAWRARVAELRAGGFRVCFSQGINIRQVDEESAAALASLEYRDNDFRNRVLYTAWDNLGDERRFKRGVEILRTAGVPPKHLRVYMLVGFAKDESFDQVLYRFNEMVALGCEPYPMVFDQSRGDLKAFQRWAIRGLYRAVPWAEYRDARKTTSRGASAA
jgi:pentatricopeptide repeat protein